MEYKLVESWDTKEVEGQVNHLLKQNWELVGGISTGFDKSNGRFYYTQAMIKKNKV